MKNPCRTCPHDHCGNCPERSMFTRAWEQEARAWEQEAVESINNKLHEIKPCPFCGEMPRVSCSGISMRFYIWCETDDCILSRLSADCVSEFLDMFDLIKAWNTRNGVISNAVN